MPSQTEIRQQITQEIIDSLKQGIVPWKRPWSADKNCGRPTNAVTKKPYNGINILLLALHSQTYRSEGKYFATYRQWQSIGGQVMARPSGVPKGEWGARVILYKPLSKTIINGKGEEVEDKFCVMRQFTVFSIDQIESDHLDHLRVGFTDNNHDPEVSIREADELIRNADVDIFHGGNRAFYEPGIDAITMPHKHQFDGTTYYETLLHELCHWGEHPDRLNWDRSEDGNGYAMGELVAESLGVSKDHRRQSAWPLSPFRNGEAGHRQNRQTKSILWRRVEMTSQLAATDNSICNSQLVQVNYSTVLRAIELTDSDPFTMTIRCPVEWAAIAQCVNQGIDSYLEAVCDPQDVFDNGNCSVTPHSLCVLLRRMGDTEFRDTDDQSSDDLWDAATSLQSSIFTVLGIDEGGDFVGREAMGLE